MARHPDLTAEQAYIDHAYACLESTREAATRLTSMVEVGRGGTEQARFERVNHRLLELSLKDRRVDELSEPLMEILAALGFSRWFDLIAGSNLDHTRVAKQEVIAHVLAERPQYRERSIVMVGDREHDIFGARAHGIETIAVAYGYGSTEEFQAASPLAVAETVEHLGELLGVW